MWQSVTIWMNWYSDKYYNTLISNIQKNEYCERDYFMAHYNIIKLTHTFNESTLIIFNAALLKAGKYRYKSFFWKKNVKYRTSVPLLSINNSYEQFGSRN